MSGVTIDTLSGFVIAIITVADALFTAGRYFGKWEVNRKQQEYWGIIELRTRIRMINEIRTDLRERITTMTPTEVEAAYLDVINGLDNQIRWLQRALDGTSENRQQNKRGE